MKRIAIFFTTALLLLSTLVFPASANEPYINPQINITFEPDYYPVIDGQIGFDEYGSTPTLSYSNANDLPQFTTPDDHDDYDNWDFDFYATADANYLYLAWSVNSFVFQHFDRYSVEPDWRYTTDDSYLGNMWRFSNVQFIITSGAPDANATDYDKNCLEVGLCQFEDGTAGTYVYRAPSGLSKDVISANLLNKAVVYNGFGTATYEIAIPWAAAGIYNVDEGSQFGLAFSVSAQYDYNDKKGMIEWTDSLLKPRDTDNAGVVTLVKSKPLPDGMAPIEALRSIRFDIDKVNIPLDSEEVVLQTTPYFPINSNWAYALLLEPIDDSQTTYRLIAKTAGTGSEIYFDEYQEGMLVLAVHSDGQSEYDAEFYEGYAEKQSAMELPLGSELTLWGVNVYAGEKTYANAMIYVTKIAEVIEESSDVSVDESLSDIPLDENTVTSSSDDSSDINNVIADATEAEEKSAFPFLSILLIIVIIIVVLILLCLPIVFIIIIILIIVLIVRKKKKKAKAAAAAATDDAENIPEDIAAVPVVDGEGTPAEDVPAEDVPAEDVPAEDVPTEDVPVEDVPAEDVPTEDVPTEDINTPNEQ